MMSVVAKSTPEGASWMEPLLSVYARGRTLDRMQTQYFAAVFRNPRLCGFNKYEEIRIRRIRVLFTIPLSLELGLGAFSGHGAKRQRTDCVGRWRADGVAQSRGDVC